MADKPEKAWAATYWNGHGINVNSVRRTMREVRDYAGSQFYESLPTRVGWEAAKTSGIRLVRVIISKDPDHV